MNKSIDHLCEVISQQRLELLYKSAYELVQCEQHIAVCPCTVTNLLSCQSETLFLKALQGRLLDA